MLAMTSLLPQLSLLGSLSSHSVETKQLAMSVSNTGRQRTRPRALAECHLALLIDNLPCSAITCSGGWLGWLGADAFEKYRHKPLKELSAKLLEVGNASKSGNPQNHANSGC
jgi:hypothetical protein